VAKKKPKITIIKSKQTISPSQSSLLDGDDWKSIQSMIEEYGPTPDTLSKIAPRMARLLRIREKQLSETERLPREVMDTLCLVLAKRTSKPSGCPQ
jgi:hypothetical protein